MVGVQSIVTHLRPKVLDAIYAIDTMLAVCLAESRRPRPRQALGTHILELLGEVVEGSRHAADDAVLSGHEAEEKGELQVAEALGRFEQLFIRHLEAIRGWWSIETGKGATGHSIPTSSFEDRGVSLVRRTTEARLSSRVSLVTVEMKGRLDLAMQFSRGSHSINSVIPVSHMKSAR